MFMIKRIPIIAAALLTSASLFAGGSAVAETATNLKCKSCVGKKDLGRKVVTGKALRNKAVTAKKIKTNTIQPGHLASAAKPAGVEYDYPLSPHGDVGLDGDDKSVLSVKMSVPGPGYVVVNADYVLYDPVAPSDARCSVRHDGQRIGDAVAATLPMSTFLPISFTRTVPSKAAGVIVIDLVCSSKTGTPGIKSPSLTALFAPNRY